MHTDRHRREAELFERACDLAPAEQLVLLARECEADPELRQRLLTLLARDREPRSKLDRPALARLAPVPAELPERLGPYRILGLLGRGGMGVVYLAEQESPRRRVALKVIQGGFVGPELVRRFEHEARVLGWLNHPGIAQIYEAGVVRGARGPEPFLAMELVQGEPLTQHAERQGLSTDARLACLASVCDAVQHAHQKGVIHRDLKPGNVLVGSGGEVKVLDFGVARVTEADLQKSTLLTRAGELVGTLPYMSPEQLAGRPEAVDTRSDVYALGVIAYQLLAGHLPLDVAHLPVPEAARVLAEREPPSLGSVDPRLRGDIETIVSKALEKDRERRYASAQELADDLRRHLRHEPIVARAASGFYHVRKFARRNRALSGSLALAVLALASATIVSTWQARVAERARAHALEQQTIAERERAQSLLAATRATISAASMAVEHADSGTGHTILAELPPEQRGFEWRRVESLLDRSLAHVTSTAPLRAAAFVSADDAPDGRAGLCFLRTSGEVCRTALGSDDAPATIALDAAITGPAAFSRDGRRLAAVVGDGKDGVSLWNAWTGERIASTAPLGTALSALGISADGTRVAFGGNTSYLWDAGSGAGPAKLHAPSAQDFAFDRGGARLASTYNWAPQGGGHFLDYDAAGAATHRAWQAFPQNVAGLDLYADGTRAALAYTNKRVVVIDVTDGRTLLELRGHTAAARCVAVDPSERMLASGSSDRTVRLWDLATGSERTALLGAVEPIVEVAFDEDGTRVLARTEHELLAWDAAETSDAGALHHPSYVYGAAFVAGGARIVSSAQKDTVRIWDAASLDLLWAAGKPGLGVMSIAVAQDSALVALAQKGALRLLDADSGTFLPGLDAAKTGAVAVALSRDGSLLAGRGSNLLQVWRIEGERALVGEWACRSATPYSAVALSPDGALVAADGPKNEIRVWSTRSGAEVACLTGHGRVVEELVFSPDGTLLASGSVDASVRLWDVATWTQRSVSLGHGDRVYALAFTPDGTRLASGSNDTSIRLWEVASGEQVAVLAGHEDYVFGLAFEPDGSRLASASGDGSVRLWDTLPRHVRWSAGERMRRARAAARPEVERMLAELGSAALVAERLKSDPARAADAREAGLQALLELTSPVRQ